MTKESPPDWMEMFHGKPDVVDTFIFRERDLGAWLDDNLQRTGRAHTACIGHKYHILL